jgi:tungstate transport system substrate-binding protein
MRSRIFVCVWLCAALVVSPGRAESPARALLLATTTSVQDSGLLDALLPRFEAQSGIHVQVVAVGSGAALRMGAEGNADVLVAHAPEQEKELVASGAVLGRRPFMENHFVIAGPAADPAGVREAATPEDALRRIAARPAPWVSRGDGSGTHLREQALLAGAGLEAHPGSGGWPGFASTGAGMGQTLQVAGERRAYVLADLGTFLAFEQRIDLVVLSKPGPSLRNEYSVLRVSPERFSKIAADAALRFEMFLLAPDTQREIGAFGRARYGRALFTPLAPLAEPPAP